MNLALNNLGEVGDMGSKKAGRVIRVTVNSWKKLCMKIGIHTENSSGSWIYRKKERLGDISNGKINGKVLLG